MRYASAYRDHTGPEVPSWTVFDGLIGYEQGPWRIALNVQNLSDKTYVPSCGARGDCWYGARRTAIVSARYRF